MQIFVKTHFLRVSEKDNELNHWRNKYSNLSSTMASATQSRSG